MNRTRVISILTVLILAALTSGAVLAQDAEDDQGLEDIAVIKQKAPKVYIDCEHCDMDYVRTEIPYVNYVRDRKEADVHILITTQTTGSGGTEYTMAFIGRGAYETINSNLIYASRTTDTEDEVRRGYVQVLKMGLMPYASRTPIAGLIDIGFRREVKPTDVIDPWKFWVFSLSLGGEFEGESQTKNSMFYTNFSANKVTPDIKIRLGLTGWFENSSFDYDGKVIDSSSESGSFNALVVKSLSDHWSAGALVSVETSTYSNLKSRITPSPALEYNLFPYAESTRRQLRFLYRVGYEMTRYRDMTIYDKMKENLLSEALSATIEVNEPWGTIEASLEGSHYFHDFKKNRLEFGGEVSFRIFKGLSLEIDGRYERVRDQLALAKGNLSLDEILLRRRELATDYNYFVFLSLSYTFGSIYSNVVNPRFGDWGVPHMEQHD